MRGAGKNSEEEILTGEDWRDRKWTEKGGEDCMLAGKDWRNGRDQGWIRRGGGGDLVREGLEGGGEGLKRDTDRGRLEVRGMDWKGWGGLYSGRRRTGGEREGMEGTRGRL